MHDSDDAMTKTTLGLGFAALWYAAQSVVPPAAPQDPVAGMLAALRTRRRIALIRR